MSHHVVESLTLLGELALQEDRTAAAVAHPRGGGHHLAGPRLAVLPGAALTSLGRARMRLDPAAARQSFQEARQLQLRLGDTGSCAELDRLLKPA